MYFILDSGKWIVLLFDYKHCMVQGYIWDADSSAYYSSLLHLADAVKLKKMKCNAGGGVILVVSLKLTLMVIFGFLGI